MRSHDFEELLTVRETMDVLRRSRAGIYLLIARGELEAVKHGKLTCFRRSEIERYLAALPKVRLARANGGSHVAA